MRVHCGALLHLPGYAIAHRPTPLPDRAQRPGVVSSLLVLLVLLACVLLRFVRGSPRTRHAAALAGDLRNVLWRKPGLRPPRATLRSRSRTLTLRHSGPPQHCAIGVSIQPECRVRISTLETATTPLGVLALHLDSARTGVHGRLRHHTGHLEATSPYHGPEWLSTRMFRSGVSPPHP